MSGGNNILSLLGLALRGGRLAVGEEPTALAAKAGQARLILLASDAAGNTLRRAEHLAREGHCLRLALPFSKAELGGALGRGSAAVAALTDTGLAAAVTERLALLEPERYGEIAARMDLKRRRAKERQAAPRRDPPRKSPPPRREDRRAPKARREGGPGGRDRPSSPGDGRTPEGRGPSGRRRERPQAGERRSAGKGRACNGSPHGDRPQAPRRPYGANPAGGRPQPGKGPGGGGHPPQKRNRPGPNSRSGGGRGRGGER